MDAIVSARAFIRWKYSVAVMSFFLRLDSCYRTCKTRARFWEENIVCSASHTAREVVH